MQKIFSIVVLASAVFLPLVVQVLLKEQGQLLKSQTG